MDESGLSSWFTADCEEGDVNLASLRAVERFAEDETLARLVTTLEPASRIQLLKRGGGKGGRRGRDKNKGKGKEEEKGCCVPDAEAVENGWYSEDIFEACYDHPTKEACQPWLSYCDWSPDCDSVDGAPPTEGEDPLLGDDLTNPGS